MDSDALERDRLYSRAEAISSSLFQVGGELQAAVSNINDLNAAAMGDTSSPVGAIIRILNNQLQALTQIDNRATELGSELGRIAAGTAR
jgi:nuclear pore complex protein Nup62